MRRGIDHWRATGAALALPRWHALLAEAYGRVGDPDAGVTVLEQALIEMEHTGERNYAAEVYRLNGVLLSQQFPPDHAAAEGSFLMALSVARRQQAKSFELRAAVSLSQLWQQQGKYIEARELLAPIYGWFTEGFDTADLREARALLEDLAQQQP
jgi:predicted ATPase